MILWERFYEELEIVFDRFSKYQGVIFFTRFQYKGSTQLGMRVYIKLLMMDCELTGSKSVTTLLNSL